MSLNSSTVIAQCTEYSIESFGGTETLVAALVRGLSAHCKIVLVSNDESEAIRRSEFSSFLAGHIRWHPDNTLAGAAQNLARALREYDVDLAHFHFGGNFGWGNRLAGQSPISFLSKLGVRCVSTVHSFDSILDGYCGAQRPLLFKLALLPAAWSGKMSVLRRVSAEVAVSQDNYNRLRAIYWPLRSRFRQIYHSRLGDVHAPASVSQREPIILSVGHIAFRKGQHILAAAFAKIAQSHPEWKLILIGDVGENACRDEIEETISANKLGDRILLLGGRDDAISFMRRASIFVQPSMFEGLGLALQEALFSGCACVGMRVGGIPELIDDGVNGLLVAPGSAEELAIALERLIKDDSLRQTLGARAPSSILEKRMTADQMINGYVKLYQSILDAR
jgi:glycosyltransferase involved in cell wall biosynthesis